MAEINYAIEIATQGASVQNSTAGYLKPGSAGEWEIEGSELDGDSDYLLIVRVHVGGLNTGIVEFEYKVIEDTVGDLPASHMKSEPRRSSGAAGMPYMYMRKVTTASTPNDYEVHLKGDGTVNASMMDLEMLMIKLDDLLSSDWAYDNDAVDNSFTGGVWEDGASITIGDGSSDWLIIQTAHWQIDSVTDDCRGRINIGGSNVMTYFMEGEDVDEEYVLGSFHYEAALATDTVVKNQFTNSDGSQDVLDNSIFALRLNAFEDHAGDRNTTKLDSGGATPVQPITLTHTTDTAANPQDWIGFSQSIGDVVASDQRRTYTGISDGGDIDFSGDDDANPFFTTKGNADLQTLNRLGIISEADATDLDWKFSSSDQNAQTGMDYIEQIICGFSLVLVDQQASYPYHIIEQRRRQMKTLITM